MYLEVVARPGPHPHRQRIRAARQRYRNLVADPVCFVSVGRLQWVPAQVRFMTSAEAPAALGRYQRAHPGERDGPRPVIEKAACYPAGQLPMAEPLPGLAPQGLSVPGW
jgi:hypothetical protein